MALFILIHFCLTKDNKLYFIEKCGLFSVNGKVIINRLKYLNNILCDSGEQRKVIMSNILKLNKFNNSNINTYFWHVPLSYLKYNNFDNNKIINEYELITFSNNINSLPDPIYSIIGITIDNNVDNNIPSPKKKIKNEIKININNIINYNIYNAIRNKRKNTIVNNLINNNSHNNSISNTHKHNNTINYNIITLKNSINNRFYSNNNSVINTSKSPQFKHIKQKNDSISKYNAMKNNNYYNKFN